MRAAPGTTVSFDAVSSTALVVMKRPVNGKVKPGTVEKFAASLQQQVSTSKICVCNGQLWVEDVSVAVPKRIPREIDRHSVLRLEVLGEGFFGEVSCTAGYVTPTTTLLQLKKDNHT